MQNIPIGLSTKAVHGEPKQKPDSTPIASPIYQSSTFVNPIGTTHGVMYTRYGNNPNQLRLGERLAALEGAENAIFLGSGMGATALAHIAVLHPGDHLLASQWIYGGTRKLFDEEFNRLDIQVSYVNPTDQRNWRRKMRKNTRAVFVEIVTNPLMRIVGLEYLALLCRERGMTLIADSTFATPINCRPLERGADIVIHSATKYLNGHSDVIAGAVAGAQPIIDEVRRLMTIWGPALDPHAAWLVERGLKTLAVRVDRHNANGMAFAEWAANHPKIESVFYPGLTTHPDHEVAKEMLSGYGGMVGITLAGGETAVQALLENLRIAAHAPSLGGVETLVSEPRYTSHAEVSDEELAAQGIPSDLIRVSLGIEDVDDIIADFDSALSAAMS